MTHDIQAARRKKSIRAAIFMVSRVILKTFTRLTIVMRQDTDKEHLFLEMLDNYKDVIAKVCCIYTSPNADFDDLYQETVINLWQGFEKFRGEAKISTWIYRAAINTCITWVRRNKKHANNIPLENDMQVMVDETNRMADYRRLHAMISRLQPLEKAIVTLWLEDKSYEEIATITGLTKSNVAVKLHRAKEKMSKMDDLRPF